MVRVHNDDVCGWDVAHHLVHRNVLSARASRLFEMRIASAFLSFVLQPFMRHSIFLLMFLNLPSVINDRDDCRDENCKA